MHDAPKDLFTPIERSSAKLTEVEALQAKVVELEHQLQQSQRELAAARIAHDRISAELHTSQAKLEIAYQQTERFHQLAQQTNQLLFIRDGCSGSYLYVSPAYEKLWGKSCDSLYQDSNSWFEAVHPDDLTAVLDALNHPFQGKPIQIEYRIIQPDCSIRWVLVQVVPVHDQAKQRIQVGTAEDITDRKRAETEYEQALTALREREEYFRLALSLNNIATWDWNSVIDRSHWNTQHFGLFGYVPGEVEPGYQPWRDRIHPDDIERVEQILAASVATKTDYQVDHRVLHPDGTMRWLVAMGRWLTDATGAANRMIGVAMDITDRKTSEIALQTLNAELEQRVQERTRELEASQALLQRQAQEIRTLVENSPDVIARFDRDHRYVFVNAAIEALSGLPAASCIGKTKQELEVLRQTAGVWEENLNRVFATGEELTVTFQFHLAQGWRYFQSHMTPEFGLDGSVETVLSICHDITNLKAIEAALSRSEEKFRRLSEVSPIGIGIGRSDGRIAYANNAYLSMLGYTEAELLTMRFMEYTHPDDLQADLTLYQQLLDGELASFQLEKRYIRKDGQPLWVNVIVTLLTDWEKGAVSSLAMVEDITERKQAEAALRQSEERFRTLFDNAPIPLSLANIHTRQLIQVNAAHQALLGYSLAELTAQTFTDITHPADITLNACLTQQMAAGNISQFQIEKRFIKKNGQTVWSHMASALIRDDNGNPCYSLAVIQDITRSKQLQLEREQAEANLRESDRRFRAIFDQTFQFCGLLSPDGRMLEANQTALDFAGLTREQVVGQPVWETRWLEHSQIAQQQLQAAIVRASTGELVRHELELQDQAGAIATIDFSLKPMKDEQEKVLLLIIEGRDISDRKRAETERKRIQDLLLQQAQRDYLLRVIMQHIHQSLELDEILSVAVTEVRDTLGADRAVIFCLRQDLSGTVIQESLSSACSSILGWHYPQDHFPTHCRTKYLQGKASIISSGTEDSHSGCLMEFLRQIQVESEIIAPIVHVSDHSNERYLWGLLIVHACTPRDWQQPEADLLQQIASQLAIAIQQADLYSQVQTELEERRQAESSLRASLQEKEVLLKEVHHRVKNNLQIISSLLRMQARKVSDLSTATLFQEAQNRVQSMAIIHEHLYQSSNLAQINFNDYLQTLLNNLFRSYGVDPQQILLDIKIDSINLPLNTAIPCGLIINELVSNMLKYAFPLGQPGTITIRLSSQTVENSSDFQGVLVIGDNGVGMSPDIDWQTTPSLGLRIVRNLVDQMQGTLTLNRDRGTFFRLTFPILT